LPDDFLSLEKSTVINYLSYIRSIVVLNGLSTLCIIYNYLGAIKE
jgi:hypothetical protein